MNANGTFEKNSQLGEKSQKTRTLVLEVNHTAKTVADIGTAVKSFASDLLTLDGNELQGEARKILAVEDLSGTTTSLSAVVESDGDIAITIDDSATIRLTYLLK